MKHVYVVKVETNDHGWDMGENFFADPNEAVKHMRDYVAYRVKWLREEGYEVKMLKCWHESISGVNLNCGAITFHTWRKDIGTTYYDFRVFSVELWESENEYLENRRHNPRL